MRSRADSMFEGQDALDETPGAFVAVSADETSVKVLQGTGC